MVVDVAAVEDDKEGAIVEAVLVDTAGREEVDGFPFVFDEGVEVGPAGTDPKDFTTPSDLRGGAAAGDEDIDAEASSIDPNVTAEPCFAAAAPALLRGMLTPSLIGIACPRALGRRECVRWGCDGVGGAGDCERGDGADEVWGGPFAQADCARSGLCDDAVEDLLIEFLVGKASSERVFSCVAFFES